MRSKQLLAFVAAALLLFATCKKDDDTPSGNTVNGTITTPTTWTADHEWVVDGMVDVESDLVIEPGTIVKFRENSGLSVGYSVTGSISAMGTADKPITFTGYNNARWDAIYLYSATNTTKTNFQHCKFSLAGGYGTIIVEDSKLKMEYSIISDCAQSAITLSTGSEFLAFNHNHLLNCGNHPLDLPSNAVATIGSGNKIEAPSGKGILINANENLTKSGTWQNPGIPYYINDYLVVTTDLVISDSVTLRFGPGAAMEFGYSEYASLKAIGTAEKPIRFTSASANPQAGDWGGLLFYSNNASSATELAYCTVEYGGSNTSGGLLYIDNTSLKMNNCTLQHSQQTGISLYYDAGFVSCNNNTISDCGTWPVEAEAGAIPSLGAGNSITAAAGSGIKVFYGNINSTATWHYFEAPYLIEEGLIIDNNGELTLDAGVTMKFGPGAYLTVGEDSFGKLVAQGTTAMPVIFTSAAGSPSAGDWAGLYFASQTRPGSKLENCRISYAGGGYYEGAVTVYECGNNLNITDTYIGFSSACGIATWQASPQLAGNSFESNAGGDMCNQ